MTRYRLGRSMVTCLIVGALVSGCSSYAITVEKTQPAELTVLSGGPGGTGLRRLIFLSPDEAKCPTQCSDVVNSTGYKRHVSYVEKKLQQKGYSLISGAIVSRVEHFLKDSDSREKWDRTEKALLLGKETGADAILEVRSLYVDHKKHYYLKAAGKDSFRRKPTKTVEKDLKAWRRDKPSNGWMWFPIVGWAILASAPTPPSGYIIPEWEATVEVRMIDLDGKVIWSGEKTVTTTNIMPEDWRARLDGHYSWSRIKGDDENFDYFEYFDDSELQRKQLDLIIDAIVAEMPTPLI